MPTKSINQNVLLLILALLLLIILDQFFLKIVYLSSGISFVAIAMLGYSIFQQKQENKQNELIKNPDNSQVNEAILREVSQLIDQEIVIIETEVKHGSTTNKGN